MYSHQFSKHDISRIAYRSTLKRLHPLFTQDCDDSSYTRFANRLLQSSSGGSVLTVMEMYAINAM